MLSAALRKKKKKTREKENDKCVLINKKRYF